MVKVASTVTRRTGHEATGKQKWLETTQKIQILSSCLGLTAMIYELETITETLVEIFVKAKGSCKMLEKDKHWDHLLKKGKRERVKQSQADQLYFKTWKNKIIILGTWKTTRKNT